MCTPAIGRIPATMPEETSRQIDRNHHVKAYLAYYVGFPHPPRYAVMLDGAWGIGKTFLLKAFLRPLRGDDFKVVYVSLYGISSVDQIDDAIFRATFPLLDNRATRLAGRLAKTAAKFFRVEPDLKPADFLQRGYADVYVFDDLERCALPVNQVLGYINELVEHEGRKVILVANEAEIQSGEAYARIREKLIGKTLEIQSAFEEALSAFLDAVRDNRARSFLVDQSEAIRLIYDQSGLHNLRILQQTIWDYERFHSVLTEKHRVDAPAMAALLRMLFALSIELKAGRLKPDDLRQRRPDLASIMRRINGQTVVPTAFEATQARYGDADLADPVLSDETLIAFLAKGLIEPEVIRAELDASSYYVVVADEPAWRTVWYAVERTDAEVEAAIAEMERAFAAREYEVIGELYHVLGLRLRLARIGAIAGSLNEVVAEGQHYIDDLYAAERLRPTDRDSAYQGYDETGYDGLAISAADTPEFRTLAAYLLEKRNAARIDRYPRIAEALLADLRHRPADFIKQITSAEGYSGEFAGVPVLATLDTGVFVDTLVELEPRQLRRVLKALKARWERDRLEHGLHAEAGWARLVRDRLAAAGSRMSPIGRERIDVFLRHTLDVVALSEDDR